MCLNLKDYLFKTNRYGSTYMNSMVTTNQKTTIDTQKQERKEEREHFEGGNDRNGCGVKERE